MTASELKRFVVHGFGNEHSRIATLVMFGRLSSPINAQTAHLLELLMPHLHCAIEKVTANKCPSVLSTTARNGRVKPLSKRELEVLEWLQAGKTNWEIGSIMEISPLKTMCRTYSERWMWRIAARLRAKHSRWA
jgi:DNA-binding NarL/FixJ family response regulator